MFYTSNIGSKVIVAIRIDDGINVGNYSNFLHKTILGLKDRTKKL